ncbi:hypothetical protein [Phaffia rhodozyma]|uniref:Uncharacterized protein n=1 Tax=Phaffia rhodozyma TaxID=264483 RepID=A0A0F7SLH1_PHARH|nr:hypothetical protein [Phaffia rhodozyma]
MPVPEPHRLNHQRKKAALQTRPAANAGERRPVDYTGDVGSEGHTPTLSPVYYIPGSLTAAAVTAVCLACLPDQSLTIHRLPSGRTNGRTIVIRPSDVGSTAAPVMSDELPFRLVAFVV